MRSKNGAATTYAAVAMTVVGLLAATACTRRERSGGRGMEGVGAAQPQGVSAQPSAAAERRPTADAPAGVHELDVDGDASAYVVHAAPADRRVVVYLHGRCVDPRRDVDALARIASTAGTLVAIAGDTACPDGTRRWTLDVDAIHARIGAAVRRAAQVRGGALDPDLAVLAGQSQGAARADALAVRYPDAYPRLVLLAAPAAPEVARAGRPRAVATLAGEKEAREAMQSGAASLAGAGVRARYFEIPDVGHGEWGADGARVLSEAIDYVREGAR